jgi:hypothetical protein
MVQTLVVFAVVVNLFGENKLHKEGRRNSLRSLCVCVCVCVSDMEVKEQKRVFPYVHILSPEYWTK